MNNELKQRVIELRKQGKTYKEIVEIIKIPIPKGTMSCWCRGIPMSLDYKNKIKQNAIVNIKKAREVALKTNKAKRENYLQTITERNQDLAPLLKDKGVAKIALTMLYLCEGSRSQRGSLMFGNSDPLIIALFLRLLRQCYSIDSQKFRCTLQCRADQDIQKLEEYWSQITNIPLTQFYKAQVDARTIGKPSKKPNYKGVCRIDYFSANIYNELKIIAELLS